MGIQIVSAVPHGAVRYTGPFRLQIKRIRLTFSALRTGKKQVSFQKKVILQDLLRNKGIIACFNDFTYLKYLLVHVIQATNTETKLRILFVCFNLVKLESFLLRIKIG